MKSKTKNKLVAFVKEALRAAVAAIMGVAGAALAGCTAVTTPADASHTIGVVGFGVPFGNAADPIGGTPRKLGRTY